MTSFDRTWLGGWIAFCLGVAHNNLTLKIVGLLMFILAWFTRRERA